MSDRETYWEDCGQCRGENQNCDLCKGSGRVERCAECRAAISADDDGDCFYCDVMGESVVDEPAPAETP